MPQISAQKMPMQGVVYALLAALLFGVTTPLAKGLLAEMGPVMLAGLFYLGSGFGLALYLVFAPLLSRSLLRRSSLSFSEASLQKPDLPWLAGAVLTGGVLAPVLLMLGLASTKAAAASLFLNLEGVFTALLAWFVFKENFDRRILLGMLTIVLGGIVLSVNVSSTGSILPSGTWSIAGGVPWIMAACICWAVDNNLTRKVSNANPAQIACLKGLFAGATNIGVALLGSTTWPSVSHLILAMTIGFFGYGVSLVLFVLALRYIGTARSGAYFALAPFVGAFVAIAFLKEAMTVQTGFAALLMAIGLWLHLTEEHGHRHRHDGLEHDHEHAHDEHHQHPHKPGQVSGVGRRHVHRHRHEGLTHSHKHFPDLHHNHEH